MPVRTAKRNPGMFVNAVFSQRGNGLFGRGTTHALVELKFRDFADDARHDLDGAGTGTDHRHALAGEVDVVVPLRGMESGTLEFGETRDIGKAWNVQRAGPRDEELRDVFLPGVGEDVPAVLGVVPVRDVVQSYCSSSF